MKGYTNASMEAILDYTLANLGSAANQFYLALYTVAPTASDEGTEVTGASYARQLTDMSRTDQTISNDDQELFPTATEDWGTITAFALHSASSGTGNMVMFGPMATSKIIETGDALVIGAGVLQQTFS